MTVYQLGKKQLSDASTLRRLDKKLCFAKTNFSVLPEQFYSLDSRDALAGVDIILKIALISLLFNGRTLHMRRRGPRH